MAFKMKNPFKVDSRAEQRAKEAHEVKMKEHFGHDMEIEKQDDMCRKKYGEGWYYDTESKSCKKSEPAKTFIPKNK